jgi:hypothetical protein
MSRLAGTLDRFTSMRERRGRIASRRVLDQLPTPAQIGATGVGGVDVNKALRPRGRRARAGPPARVHPDSTLHWPTRMPVGRYLPSIWSLR